MKLKDAIKILITHACSNIKGAGLGIRTIPPEHERQNVQDAVERGWKYIYNRDMQDNDKFNNF